VTSLPSRVRILLADDHPLVRSGIRATLSGEASFEVVGEATNGAEVQLLCQELRPDLLLLDLSMPGPSPLETITCVRQLSPETRVLVLTAYDDDAYVRNIINIGVDGYLLKDEATEALVQAIKAVVQGGTWFSRVVMQKFVVVKQDPDAEAGFTPRELELLASIGQGWDNRRIASEFDLAEQTVRNYISRIYEKLGVRSRAEAVVWARENGYTGDLS
jgi:two-component system nitrate/nitrite response regulator NarL